MSSGVDPAGHVGDLDLPPQFGDLQDRMDHRVAIISCQARSSRRCGSEGQARQQMLDLCDDGRNAAIRDQHPFGNGRIKLAIQSCQLVAPAAHRLT